MLIARQVDPAKQESPWMRDSYEDEYYDGVIIIGDNGDFSNDEELLKIANEGLWKRRAFLNLYPSITLSETCDMLGENWRAKKIDDNYFFWDKDVNPTGIDWIIMSYLNTGTEWEIESRENEWTENLYCYESPAKEIYENFASPGEEIEMHWFDGRIVIE